MAVDKMREQFSSVYFLTLTTADKCTPCQVSYRWRELIHTRYWKKLHIAYVQVLEKHPGGHGWHIHAVVSSRIPVDTFRPLLKSCGFGRFHIVKCNRHLDRITYYLAKYIGKSLPGMRDPELKNVRMVNVSRGLPVLSQIQVVDPCIDFVKSALENIPPEFPRYRAMCAMSHIYYTFPYHSYDYLAEIGCSFRLQEWLLDQARKIFEIGVDGPRV